jgi:hypothetical protein
MNDVPLHAKQIPKIQSRLIEEGKALCDAEDGEDPRIYLAKDLLLLFLRPLEVSLLALHVETIAHLGTIFLGYSVECSPSSFIFFKRLLVRYGGSSETAEHGDSGENQKVDGRSRKTP